MAHKAAAWHLRVILRQNLLRWQMVLMWALVGGMSFWGVVLELPNTAVEAARFGMLPVVGTGLLAAWIGRRGVFPASANRRTWTRDPRLLALPLSQQQQSGVALLGLGVVASVGAALGAPLWLIYFRLFLPDMDIQRLLATDGDHYLVITALVGAIVAVAWRWRHLHQPMAGMYALGMASALSSLVSPWLSVGAVLGALTVPPRWAAWRPTGALRSPYRPGHLDALRRQLRHRLLTRAVKTQLIMAPVALGIAGLATLHAQLGESQLIFTATAGIGLVLIAEIGLMVQLNPGNIGTHVRAFDRLPVAPRDLALSLSLGLTGLGLSVMIVATFIGWSAVLSGDPLLTLGLGTGATALLLPVPAYWAASPWIGPGSPYKKRVLWFLLPFGIFLLSVVLEQPLLMVPAWLGGCALAYIVLPHPWSPGFRR